MSNLIDMLDNVKDLLVQRKSFKGHKGRPGKVGGSLPKGQGSVKAPTKRMRPPVMVGKSDRLSYGVSDTRKGIFNLVKDKFGEDWKEQGYRVVKVTRPDGSEEHHIITSKASDVKLQNITVIPGAKIQEAKVDRASQEIGTVATTPTERVNVRRLNYISDPDLILTKKIKTVNVDTGRGDRKMKGMFIDGIKIGRHESVVDFVNPGTGGRLRTKKATIDSIHWDTVGLTKLFGTPVGSFRYDTSAPFVIEDLGGRSRRTTGSVRLSMMDARKELHNCAMKLSMLANVDPDDVSPKSVKTNVTPSPGSRTVVDKNGVPVGIIDITKVGNNWDAKITKIWRGVVYHIKHDNETDVEQDIAESIGLIFGDEAKYENEG